MITQRDKKGRFNKGRKLTYEQEEKRRKNISKSQRGVKVPLRSRENHWNWKGGITYFTQMARTTRFYKIWRNAVFLRDNFICQNPNCEFCNNKIGVKLHAHHIKSFSSNMELMFKVDNGITYCKGFHIKSGLHSIKLKEIKK